MPLRAPLLYRCQTDLDLSDGQDPLPFPTEIGSHFYYNCFKLNHHRYDPHHHSRNTQLLVRPVLMFMNTLAKCLPGLPLKYRHAHHHHHLCCCPTKATICTTLLILAVAPIGSYHNLPPPPPSVICSIFFFLVISKCTITSLFVDSTLAYTTFSSLLLLPVLTSMVKFIPLEKNAPRRHHYHVFLLLLFKPGD